LLSAVVDLANAIIALRGYELSARWEEFWEIVGQLELGSSTHKFVAHPATIPSLSWSGRWTYN